MKSYENCWNHLLMQQHLHWFFLILVHLSIYHQIIPNHMGGIFNVPTAPNHIVCDEHHHCHRCHHCHCYHILGNFLQWILIGSNIHHYHPVIIKTYHFQKLILDYQIGICFFVYGWKLKELEVGVKRKTINSLN